MSRFHSKVTSQSEKKQTNLEAPGAVSPQGLGWCLLAGAVTTGKGTGSESRFFKPGEI